MATLDQDLKNLIDDAAEQQSLGDKSDRTETYQVAQLLSSLGIQDIGNNIDYSLDTVATKLDTINATLAATNTKLDTANTTLSTIATNTTPTTPTA